MGCTDGTRTRRYHALLLVASPDSERRFVLVNGVEAWFETEPGGGTVALSSQRYAPDGVVHPAGAMLSAAFSSEPWPHWDCAQAAKGTGAGAGTGTGAGAGARITHEIHGVHASATTLLHWRFEGRGKARLHVRLLMSGRDWHALHHENPAFRFAVEQPARSTWRFAPYDGVPPIVVASNGRYAPSPTWYRQFLYEEERERGLDCVEDLASPGVFTWDLDGTANPEAELVLTTSPEWRGLAITGDVAAECQAIRERERARIERVSSRMERAAEAYLVQRGARRTIIAGYPWFTDWGRDTFIALRGLCLATGRVADAEAILLSWCDQLSDGMLPNLFPSGGAAPEYNSVDASLWFVVAVRALSNATSGQVPQIPAPFIAACDEILTRYSRGTRYGIRMDSDGLLAAGAPGVALTWMDAIVDGVPVTPRAGKAVEVQALWINALEFAASWNTRWRVTAARARDSFAKRFWNERHGCLFDVVDVDHMAGAVDDRLRPNQVFACGGLPLALVEGTRAKSIVDVLVKELWTPMGLRTLACSEPGYVGRVDGPLRERDRGYHQGTVWPWLTYAFLDAWTRANGTTWDAARERFLPALLRHVETAGSGHVSEIADGDAPHEPRGCPLQAWSLGELLRVTRATE